jgi:hypothetical protein
VSRNLGLALWIDSLVTLGPGAAIRGVGRGPGPAFWPGRSCSATGFGFFFSTFTVLLAGSSSASSSILLLRIFSS